MEPRTGLCVVLLVAAVVGATTVAATPVSGQTGVIAQQSAVDADDVRITVTLGEDGTAEWRLAFRSVLANDDEQAAFDSLQADIADDPAAYTDPFAERIRRTVATAENTTDREMAADSFSVDTETQSLGREYGIVTYRFTWENFATTSGDTLRAGDAIDGFFLDDQTRLRMQWPDGYTVDTVSPAADETPDNAVVWDGESTDFVTGEPRVVVAASGSGLTPGMLIGIIIVILLAGVGGWFYQRRPSDTDDDPPTAAVDTDVGTETDADIETDVDTETDASTHTDASSTESDTDTAASTAAAADDEPDPELLSNEEQVLRLLDDHGGRMKQKQVVEELDWTDAKTSKVVSGLREDGTIDSFRIGRENVLTYPDESLTGDDDDEADE
ncbi:hypothetical protein DM826_03865 [Halonotius aquaticus]|uniref:IclR helix-turn-helix domain-containing protein n=1 Tax=Halonotius aquaticus TaxID=2216978 RepID=A0A3A6QDT3_9EURY|nr:hypothetical protein [Halonotius aquaticus]RJX44220.1 hypothetical protein DM826_03865 [Halonotius aquaticus]